VGENPYQLFKLIHGSFFDQNELKFGCIEEAFVGGQSNCVASTKMHTVWKSTLCHIFLNTDSTAKADEISIQHHSFIQDTCKK